MKRLRRLFFVLVGVCAVATPLFAGESENNQPLICAAIETYECGAGGECLRGTAKSIHLPQFLKINFKEDKITGTMEDGSVVTTRAQYENRIDGKHIFQGVEQGMAWSLVITEATGKMTLTASDDQVGFVVHGACVR
jgi:hypothetical protein